MEGKLVIQAPGGQRHDFPLVRPVTTIGRRADCDLVLDYDHVSRLHARVERTGDGYVVVDCQSTNGTFVNGRRIGDMQLLASGDRIAIGDISITFFDAAAGDEATTLFRPISSDSPVRCDSATWEVWIGDERVDTRLSLQEFELLSLLASRYGKVCTRDELGTAIWGRGNYDYNMLHRLILRLKRKLGPAHEGLIKSVTGVGYRIEAD